MAFEFNLDKSLEIERNRELYKSIGFVTTDTLKFNDFTVPSSESVIVEKEHFFDTTELTDIISSLMPKSPYTVYKVKKRKYYYLVIKPKSIPTDLPYIVKLGAIEIQGDRIFRYRITETKDFELEEAYDNFIDYFLMRNYTLLKKWSLKDSMTTVKWF